MITGDSWRPHFQQVPPEANATKLRDTVEFCLFQLLQHFNVKVLNGKGNPTPHELYSSNFRIKVSLQVPLIRRPFMIFPTMHLFIGAATPLNWSLESRYVTLEQGPVRLAVSYCIVKCPSWWKWAKLKGTLLLEGPKAKTHTHTHTHRSLQSPASNAQHLPSRPDSLLDIEVKIKACGTLRDRDHEGKFVTYPLP